MPHLLLKHFWFDYITRHKFAFYNYFASTGSVKNKTFLSEDIPNGHLNDFRFLYHLVIILIPFQCFSVHLALSCVNDVHWRMLAISDDFLHLLKRVFIKELMVLSKQLFEVLDVILIHIWQIAVQK